MNKRSGLKAFRFHLVDSTNVQENRPLLFLGSFNFFRSANRCHDGAVFSYDANVTSIDDEFYERSSLAWREKNEQEELLCSFEFHR